MRQLFHLIAMSVVAAVLLSCGTSGDLFVPVTKCVTKFIGGAEGECRASKEWEAMAQGECAALTMEISGGITYSGACGSDLYAGAKFACCPPKQPEGCVPEMQGGATECRTAGEWNALAEKSCSLSGMVINRQPSPEGPCTIPPDGSTKGFHQVRYACCPVP